MLKSRKETERKTYRGRLLAALVLILGFAMINTGMTADAAKAKFVKRAGRTYYYDAKGRKATGLKKIKGKWYYFSKKGVRYQKGWQTIKGKKYYFSKKNGAAYTGVKKIDGKLYLFAKNGKRYGSGLIIYSGKTYYVKGGNVQTGWKNLKGKWIGNKYVGGKGYVTIVNDGKKPNNPNVASPFDQPVVEEPKGQKELFYNETYSNQIFEEINLVREHYELEPLKKATGTLLTESILRGSYNVMECENLGKEDRKGIVGALASHGAGQIGHGTNGGPEYAMEPTYNAKTGKTVSGVVDGWINSKEGHLNNLLTQHNDYMAVAFMYSDVDPWGWGDVSVIVTFGAQGTNHYFINGEDMGVYNPDIAPLYGYSVRYVDGDSDCTKEYIAEGLGVPYEKWDEYLSSYKIIR